MAQKKDSDLWKGVDTLINRGLYRSALERVTAIYESAKNEEKGGEAVKALLLMLKLEAEFTEDHFQKSVSFITSEMESARSPMQQVLASILAEAFHNYYQNNQWMINQRTPVSGSFSGDAGFGSASLGSDSENDPGTWDRHRFIAASTHFYLLSLNDPLLLQSTPVSQFGEALEGDSLTRRLRPTLYDLLAFRALDYFSGAGNFPQAGGVGFLPSQEEWFAPVSRFTQSEFLSAREDSATATLLPEVRSLLIYQELLRSKAGGEPAAFVDANLHRLAFAFGATTHPEKEELYIHSLRKFAAEYQGRPESAPVLFALANQLRARGYRYQPLLSDDYQWEVKEALELAESVATQFPETPGGKNCLALAKQIRTSVLNITGSGEVIPFRPSLVSVEFRNVDTLWLRVVALDPDIDRFYRSEGKEIGHYAGKKPVMSWSQPLPGEGDFQTHRTELMVPPLKPGYYLLLASAGKGFSKNDQLCWLPFWSTGLSLVTGYRRNMADELLAVDRLSGEPLAGVAIQPFYRKYDPLLRKQVYLPGETVVTDSGGSAKLKVPKDKNLQTGYFQLTRETDKYIPTPFYMGYYGEQEPEKVTLVSLFTDRSIYRPGQTVWFKGIVIEKEGEQQQIKSSFKVTVKFSHVNRQLIASQELVTNEFGSFSGSFEIPKGVLTGNMLIHCDYGEVDITVEEYKRPKFEVTFTPVEGSFQLGDTVTLKGQALNYAGMGTGDARVVWRVVRNARFPFPIGRSLWFPRIPETEIASGYTVTGGDGSFSLSFIALPELSISMRGEEIFNYSVYADVTDINGETRSGEYSLVAARNPALIITSLGELVNAATGREVKVTVTRPGGEPLEALVSYSVTRLNAPLPVLFPRKWSRPDKFTLSREEFKKWFPEEVYDQPEEISEWTRGRVVDQGSFHTRSDEGFTLKSSLPAGAYLLTLNATDSLDREVTYSHSFRIFSPEEGKTAFSKPLTALLLKAEAQPGETIPLLVASPLKGGVLFLEAESKGGVILKKKVIFNQNQVIVPIPVSESDRGDIVINMVMVRNNRVFTETLRIAVPYTQKELTLTAGSFRSALEPGAEEEWQITISDFQGSPVVAELMAGMYDASLDAFTPHNWPFSLYSSFFPQFRWQGSGFSAVQLSKNYIQRNYLPLTYTQYERLPWIAFFGRGRMPFLKEASMGNASVNLRSARSFTSVQDAVAEESEVFYSMGEAESLDEVVTAGYSDGALPPESVPAVSPRKDFNETAFFFPQLATNSEGEVILKFKMPESLTRWKMMALAHTRDLQSGTLTHSLVTRKELMVFPNPPRFLREGDRMVFAVKISNLSDQSLSGNAEIAFFDALTMQPVTLLAGTENGVKEFAVEKEGSTTAEWEVLVPEGVEAVVYRVTARAGAFSDGEEAALPVLPNRMMVTESLPLPIRGGSSKEFRFEKLAASGKEGSTLRNYRFSLEFSSNPAWYAVQALPYLMEYPHECSEQIFSRFFANSLAAHIAGSDPAIAEVFNAWKELPADALRSQLEKNEEFKSVLLEETPWVRQAGSDSERKQQLALLFDAGRLKAEQNSAVKKLKELQSVNGGWPWFPGMAESQYITRHILTGFGRLISRGVVTSGEESVNAITSGAISYLDTEMVTRFEKLKKEDKSYLKHNHLTSDVIHYFYARTFFLESHPFPVEMGEMVNYYRTQAATSWKGFSNYMKGMTALFLNRLGDGKLAAMIMESLSETAIHSNEMGMYWRNQPRGWFWYEAPVETHALLTEAFDEVAQNRKAVEELKVWLLKQKQTQDWKSTRATAEAVWALLMRGESLLTSDSPVSITAGGHQLNPALTTGASTEPGTGYFKVNFENEEIQPSLAEIEVNNPNSGIAWGAAYWQYFEQIDKITPAETPLQVSKQLFREVSSPRGRILEAIDESHPLKVGDKVVVRVILKTDRDMEYVHLKDMRASGFEPVNVLSGYRIQGGLGYYESTRDAATHFFIGYLPKGSYVLEYRLHAFQKGEFSNGITSVMGMYAPEFGAHSEGIRVTVE